jgi:hypothetical protein
MTVISPTPGRIVWFWPGPHEGIVHAKGEPLAAIVASVVNDRKVNLTVFDGVGRTHHQVGITLVQGDDLAPLEVSYCAWMPYQIGQAKKP